MKIAWTQKQVDNFIEWHESVIAQYPDINVIYNGKVYNTQRDLREDRISFIARVPVQ